MTLLKKCCVTLAGWGAQPPLRRFFVASDIEKFIVLPPWLFPKVRSVVVGSQIIIHIGRWGGGERQKSRSSSLEIDVMATSKLLPTHSKCFTETFLPKCCTLFLFERYIYLVLADSETWLKRLVELRTRAIYKEHENYIFWPCFAPQVSYIKQYLPPPKGKFSCQCSSFSCQNLSHLLQIFSIFHVSAKIELSEDILYFPSNLKLLKNISFFPAKIKLSKNQALLVLLSLAGAGLQNFSPSLSQTPEILSKWSKLVLSKS